MEMYLLKSAACMAILYAFYKLFLERENMHTLKRFYLLGIVIVSFTIPFITFTEYIEVESVVGVVYTTEYSGITMVEEKAPNYLALALWCIFGLGVALFGGKFGKNLFKMIQKIRKNPHFKDRNIFKVLLQNPTTPHTFLSYVFLNKNEFEANEIPKEVIDHEEVHARQMHSLDILFIELLLVVFWFNPILHLIRRSIKLNHEFLADSAVLRSGIDATTYQNTLLAFSSSASSPSLANPINYSFIKKRIKVMKKHTSKRSTWIRSLVVLPLLAMLVYGFSTTEQVVKDDNPITLEDTINTDLTARSMEISILDNNTYLVNGIRASKNTLASVAESFHQDISYQDRNRILNIHIIEPTNAPRAEVQFIFDALWDYGFHRLVTGNQEVVRSKGNTPMASESDKEQKSYAQEYLEGATKNGKKAFVLEIINSKIKFNNRYIALKDLAKTIDAYTKNWEETDYTGSFPSILIKNTPDEFLEKVEDEFAKTNYSKANGGMSIIPPPPPPPPAPGKKNGPNNTWVSDPNEPTNTWVSDPTAPSEPPIVTKMDLTKIPNAKRKVLLSKYQDDGGEFYFNNRKITYFKAVSLIDKLESYSFAFSRGPNQNPKVYINNDGSTPNFPVPPPPPPPSLENTWEEGSEDKNNPPPPPPPAPEDPIKHIEKMAKKGATFYYEGEKISAAKALAIVEADTGEKLNIQSTGVDSKKPVVKISKAPIYLRKKSGDDKKGPNPSFNHAVSLTNNTAVNNQSQVQQQDPLIDLRKVISEGATFYLNDKKISTKQAKELVKKPDAIATVNVVKGKDGKPVVYFWSQDVKSSIKTTKTSFGPTEDPAKMIYELMDQGAKFYLGDKEISGDEAVKIIRNNLNNEKALIDISKNENGQTMVQLMGC